MDANATDADGQREGCGTSSGADIASPHLETTTADLQGEQQRPRCRSQVRGCCVQGASRLAGAEGRQHVPGGRAGAKRAFIKEGAAAEKTNELLENALNASKEFFKQRGYDPKKPEEVKAKLGYALDTYEVAAYLVTGAMHLPLHLSQPDAMVYGKRVNNIIGASGSVGKQLIRLRKRGNAAAPQVAALLRATSTLNLAPPPRSSAPPPAPAPPPVLATSTRATTSAIEQALQVPTEDMARACEYAYVTEYAWRQLDDWLETPTGPDDPEYEEYVLDQQVERRTLGYRHVVVA